MYGTGGVQYLQQTRLRTTGVDGFNRKSMPLDPEKIELQEQLRQAERDKRDMGDQLREMDSYKASL